MIQIDMPMPTNCATCRIQHNIGCNIAKDNGMNTKERDVRCPLKELIQCKDCKHGSLYCTEDVCGETLIECNRPDLGDVIEIHGWKWFCADGEKRTD